MCGNVGSTQTRYISPDKSPVLRKELTKNEVECKCHAADGMKQEL